MNRLLFGVVAALCLVGCANFNETMKSWEGHPLDEVVANWGPPTSLYQRDDGGVTATWSRSGNMTLYVPGGTTPQTTRTTGNITGTYGQPIGGYNSTSTTYVQQPNQPINIPMSCTASFTTNSQKVITSWSWQGNNCR